MVGVGSRRWLCLLGMVVSLVAFGAAARADQTSAMRLYAAKKYGEAFQQFLPLAEGGNPVAQFFMAVMFDNGQSVPVDHATAAGWYRRASASGERPELMAGSVAVALPVVMRFLAAQGVDDIAITHRVAGGIAPAEDISELWSCSPLREEEKHHRE